MDLAISYMAIALVEKILGNWTSERHSFFMAIVNFWYRKGAAVPI